MTQPPSQPVPIGVPSPTTAGQLGRLDLRLAPTPGFSGWMKEQELSLGFTTYHSGTLCLLGRDETGELTVVNRVFDRPMGIWADEEDLFLSTAFQIWRFVNVLPKGRQAGKYDRLYSPRTGHVVGAIDAHDVVCDQQRNVVFVNTRFSCLATVSPGYSFRPHWIPPWISQLAPEDRCHLNGLCTRDGAVRYVSSVSRTDTAEGWREHRVDGGVIYDIVEGRPVAEGLSMPHSPRWHEGALYFLEAGRGSLCRINPETGTRQEIAFCEGFPRGLALHGDYALVGVSDVRENRTFDGIPLGALLRDRGQNPACALLVVNLVTGAIEHRISIEGSVRELYDVVVFPGVTRPNAFGFMSDDVKYIIGMDERDQPAETLQKMGVLAGG